MSRLVFKSHIVLMAVVEFRSVVDEIFKKDNPNELPHRIFWFIVIQLYWGSRKLAIFRFQSQCSGQKMTFVQMCLVKMCFILVCLLSTKLFYGLLQNPMMIKFFCKNLLHFSSHTMKFHNSPYTVTYGRKEGSYLAL